MGNATSKAAKSAGKYSATNAARKYPSRPPPRSSNRSNAPAEPPSSGATPGPTVHPKPQVSDTRDQAVNLDASDPDIALNARARKLGPVEAHPTLSHSSTFNQPRGTQSVFPSSGPGIAANPAVSLLVARERLADEAEEEFSNVGRKGQPGRRFLDAITVRQVLQMRAKGVKGAEIEERLGLRRGVVGVLGGRNVVGLTDVM